MATVSDISTAEGRHITDKAFQASPNLQRRSLYKWIRPTDITDHQAKLWSKALRQRLTFQPFSKGVTMDCRRLKVILGPWIQPPNQSWPQYHNHTNQTLIIYRERHSAQVYQLTHSSRHARFFKRQASTSDTHSASSQQSLIPADLLESEDPSLMKAVIGPFISPTQQPLLAHHVTLSEYVNNLPPERKQLLSWCRPQHPFNFQSACDIFTTALHKNKVFEIAPDGGLNASRGTFGVVLAVGEEVKWECACPTDGNPSTANSKRSEIGGYASSLEMLLLLLRLISHSYSRPFKSRMTVHTWIDNDGAVGHLNRLLQSCRPSRRYPNNQDLLSHIKWLWTKLPRVDWKVEWVKGHQDTQRPFDELPRNARLNILAYALATSYYHEVKSTNQKPRSQSLFFPSSRIRVIVNGQRVTANVPKAMRFTSQGCFSRSDAPHGRMASGTISPSIA